jgi:hypothetical protein
MVGHLRLSASWVDVEVEAGLDWQGYQTKLLRDWQAETSGTRQIFQLPQKVEEL